MYSRGTRAGRVVAALAGSLVLLVSAIVVPTAATASSSPPTSVAEASSRAPFCSLAELRIGYHAGDAGAGHRYGRIVLRNASDHACRTHGYGGVSYTDSLGRQIGAAASRTAGREPHLLLQPGQRAASRVDEVVAQDFPRSRCHPARVSDLQVYPPEGEYAVLLAHRTTGCRNPAVRLVSHGPYRRA